MVFGKYWLIKSSGGGGRWGGGGAVLLKSITQGEGGNVEDLVGSSMLGIFQFYCTGLPGLLG